MGYGIVGSAVKVDWCDSAQYMLEWATAEEAADYPLAIVHSVGYLLALTNEKIVLASESEEAHGHVKNFTVIPCGCVLSICRLEADVGA